MAWVAVQLVLDALMSHAAENLADVTPSKGVAPPGDFRITWLMLRCCHYALVYVDNFVGCEAHYIAGVKAFALCIVRHPRIRQVHSTHAWVRDAGGHNMPFTTPITDLARHGTERTSARPSALPGTLHRL